MLLTSSRGCGVVVDPEREHVRDSLGMTSSTAVNASTSFFVELSIHLILDICEHTGGGKVDGGDKVI